MKACIRKNAMLSERIKKLRLEIRDDDTIRITWKRSAFTAFMFFFFGAPWVLIPIAGLLSGKIADQSKG
jgi:hypothetical protein